MDISVLNGVTSDYLNGVAKDASLVKKDDNTFDSVLSSAMSALDETNGLQNSAESEEVRFLLGESDNTHDLLTAQTKALTALQYTTAIRDKMIDAYKEIMQISI